MRFDADTRTRISADISVNFDPTGSTVELQIDSTWYPATWLGTPVLASGKWTQTARTNTYFAGPSAVLGPAVLLALGRHLSQARITTGTDIIALNSPPVDVAP